MNARAASLTTVLLLTIGGGLAAQSTPKAEVGTRMGLSVFFGGGSAITSVAAPGASIMGNPAIYATFFGEQVALEPEATVFVVSGGGQTITRLAIGVQLKRFFRPVSENSVYVSAVGGATRGTSGFGSTAEYGLGAGIGHRWAGSRFAVSTEARYLRLFADATRVNAITLAVSVGGVIER